MNRIACVGFVLTVMVLLGSTTAPVAGAAATIVVNMTDSTTGPCSTTGTGSCTLRDAINFANNNAGADTITFSVSGVIFHFAVLPTINDTLTIDGGNHITVDGSDNVKLFVVQGTLNLSSLIVANAYCDEQSGGGGAVTNFGTLNTNQVTFANNDSTECLGGAAIDNQGGTVSVQGSIFEGNVAGSGGGAIQNSGTLSVSGSRFSNNSVSDFADGGGIYNKSGGTANITTSAFSANQVSNGNGGAIANDNGSSVNVKNSYFSGNISNSNGGAISNDAGTLTVANTQFAANTAYEGGAVYVDGTTATISKSTFTDNSGWDEGGAIYHNSGNLTVRSSTFSGNTGEIGGGAIYVDNTASLVVVNSTFTGNTAKPYGNGGAIYNWDGKVRVTSSTIVSNGVANLVHHAGGIYNYSGNVTLRNTIVADNAEYGCYSGGGSISADHFNLNDDSSCGNATVATLAQLELSPLQDNGGPTQTRALGAGSVALDAGDNTICAAAVGGPYFGTGGKDQRGVPRPQGATCDIGAFESNTQYGPGFVVNDTADTADGVCSELVAGSSNCTLRDALNAANARGGSDKITFNVPAGTNGCSGVNTCTFSIGSALPAVASKITMDGSANKGVILLYAATANPILTVNSGNLLNVNALTFMNGGDCDDCINQGGIFNLGTLNVTNSTFTANQATASAGSGITNLQTATVTNSTFSSTANSSLYTGIYNGENGVLNVTNSTIAGNGRYGLYYGGTVTLRNTIVANNAAGNCQSAGGTLNANARNLATDGSCGSATQKTSAELALGVLKSNDGSTQTVKPGTSSAARDAGSNAVCAAAVGAPNYGAGGMDQRGVTRPQGTKCDVGAFEVRVK